MAEDFQRQKEKQALLRKLKHTGEELLKQRRIILITEFEDTLAEAYPDEVIKFNDKTKAGRVEWKNLVDWVKAYFTQEGILHYFGKYMIYLPKAGRVNGELLVNFSEVEPLLLAMYELIP